MSLILYASIQTGAVLFVIGAARHGAPKACRSNSLWKRG